MVSINVFEVNLLRMYSVPNIVYGPQNNCPHLGLNRYKGSDECYMLLGAINLLRCVMYSVLRLMLFFLPCRYAVIYCT